MKKEIMPMKEAIYNIINDMVEYLDVSQMKRLHEVLIKRLTESQKEEVKIIDNCEYMNMFLAAKKIEGCSKRTLQFYRVTIEKMLSMVEIPLQKMTTEVLRKYLADYQNLNNCSKVTIDNIRRNLSSFFSWLEEEDYILKSPMRRIHKIKTGTIVKEIISDESMEKLRDHCKEARDLAMIDLLFSTGIRVG